MKVLIIDDQPETRQQVFMDIFQAVYPDWEIHQALNGEQALEAFEKHHFNLVFFDHDLGYGQDGSSVAYKVLDRPGKYKCPGKAIIHTNNWHGARNIAAKLRSGGVPHYIMEFGEYLLRDLKDRKGFEQLVAEMTRAPVSE